jgi:cysteinyl-tRNA synthetase
MSKSLGNLITVKQALERYSADAIRLFIIGSHYRSPLTYSEESLKAAEVGMERLRQATRGGGGSGGKGVLDSEPFRRRFIDSMDDDFNTAQAVAALFDLAREINRTREENYDVADAQNTLAELAKVLGFTLEEPTRPPLDAEPLIQLLIEIRDELRKAKQWQLADMVRQRLIELGVALEDTPKGTVWKRTL